MRGLEPRPLPTELGLTALGMHLHIAISWNYKVQLHTANAEYTFQSLKRWESI